MDNLDISQYEQLVELGITWGARLFGALVILIAGWAIGGFVSKKINNAKKLDKTLSSFLGRFAKYVILAVAFIAVLGQFGVQTASLLLSNIAAGTMLLVLRPFNVGDYIEFSGNGGTVTSLGLFGTELNTVDNRYVFAPNSSVWGSEIVNFSRNKQRRQDLSIGISYGSDINKAFKTIENVVSKEKRLITTSGKEPIIAVEAMADSSVNIKVRVWTKTDDYFPTQWDLLKAIKEELDKDGIDIPFPTRTLEISNPEALKS